MDCSMQGLPVHYKLPEFTQTHVQWVGDVIQPSHSLSSPSPPTFNLSQHQGLFSVSQFFPSGGQSIGVSATASVLPVNIQDWFPLGWTGLISLHSKGLSRVFSKTTVQKQQFFVTKGFPDGSASKESAHNVRCLGSIPGLGRSPGKGKGCPLQYSRLENSMDCIIQGVAKNRTGLRDFHFPFCIGHWVAESDRTEQLSLSFLEYGAN